MDKKRILILYAKVGGGHESLAWGIKERLEQAFPDKLKIELIDPIAAVFNPAYQISTMLTPDIYNLFYRYFLQKQYSKKIVKKINQLLHQSKLKDILEKFKPHMIISTHYLFSSEVKTIIAKQGDHIPVVEYIADPYAPQLFSFTGIDLFLSFDLKHLQTLKKQGINIDYKKIIPIGMPLRMEFYKTYNRNTVQKEIGFNPKKYTILFGGSGSGMDNLERIASGISELPYDFQAIFVCGRNIILKKALNIAFAKRKDIKVFGFIPSIQVARLMQASDVFVGKAGPNVLCETTMSLLPIIATPPILGQEKGNRNFIQKANIGLLSTTSSQTLQLLKKILQNPTLLDIQRKNLKQSRRDILLMEKKGFPKFIQWMEKNIFQR